MPGYPDAVPAAYENQQQLAMLGSLEGSLARNVEVYTKNDKGDHEPKFAAVSPSLGVEVPPPPPTSTTAGMTSKATQTSCKQRGNQSKAAAIPSEEIAQNSPRKRSARKHKKRGKKSVVMSEDVTSRIPDMPELHEPTSDPLAAIPEDHQLDAIVVPVDTKKGRMGSRKAKKVKVRGYAKPSVAAAVPAEPPVKESDTARLGAEVEGAEEGNADPDMRKRTSDPATADVNVEANNAAGENTVCTAPSGSLPAALIVAEALPVLKTVVVQNEQGRTDESGRMPQNEHHGVDFRETLRWLSAMYHFLAIRPSTCGRCSNPDTETQTHPILVNSEDIPSSQRPQKVVTYPGAASADDASGIAPEQSSAAGDEDFPNISRTDVNVENQGDGVKNSDVVYLGSNVTQDDARQNLPPNVPPKEETKDTESTSKCADVVEKPAASTTDTRSDAKAKEKRPEVEKPVQEEPLPEFMLEHYRRINDPRLSFEERWNMDPVPRGPDGKKAYCHIGCTEAEWREQDKRLRKEAVEKKARKAMKAVEKPVEEKKEMNHEQWVAMCRRIFPELRHY
ncbi:hypothetical protein HK102_009053 [Quaeritorhiza haematococci]|nr:hypothetical protein HK102_009053 [Quaeritorhiza haematococci]